VESESGPFQRMSAQVTFNVFLGHRLVLAVFCFGSEALNAFREKRKRGKEKEERESFNAKG
jgi:hypothetical protein